GRETARTPSSGLARGSPRTSGRGSRRCRIATTDSDSTTRGRAAPRSSTASRRRKRRKRRAPFAGRTRRLPYHSWSLSSQCEPRWCLARPYRSEPVNPMNGDPSARPNHGRMSRAVGADGHFGGSAGRAGREPRQGRDRRSRETGAGAAASSVLKFDIAVLFNRHLLERFHRALQQSGVVGIPRLAVETAARGLGASDAAHGDGGDFAEGGEVSRHFFPFIWAIWATSSGNG